MSDKVKETVETEQERLTKCMQELQALFDKYNVRLDVVAKGLRSGKVSPIEDFLPTTHVAEGVVVPNK